MTNKYINKDADEVLRQAEAALFLVPTRSQYTVGVAIVDTITDIITNGTGSDDPAKLIAMLRNPDVMNFIITLAGGSDDIFPYDLAVEVYEQVALFAEDDDEEE